MATAASSGGAAQQQQQQVDQQPQQQPSNKQAAALIEATSQLSRFHLETLENTGKALQLQQVNLSVADRVLLQDAVLALMPGVRYGLIGRNGVGKSTLLKVLGTRTLIGFPSWLTCMHVEQEARASVEETPVQAVLASDAQAQRLQREVDLLEAALDSQDEQQLVAAVTAVQAAETAATAGAAAATAARRSGRRGVAARKVALAAEQTAAAAAAGGLSAAAAAALAPELLHARYEALAELDADSAEGRARQILTGLGFSAERMDGPTARLSGGWRMRLALAQALFGAPDILCLDEPTNFLDLTGILWLQQYLTTSCSEQTLLIVSHDRAFLNAVCQETLELRDRSLRYFPGPYDAYVAAKAEAALVAGRQASALDKQKTHLQASIAAAEKQARQAGDDKKLLQVASRKKKLAERHGLESNAAGRRFKLNRDLVGYHESRRPQVVLETPERPFAFSWPQPEDLRSAGAAGMLLELRGVSFTYPGAAAPVLHDVTLNIMGRSRIALLGKNGAGKSTLMQLLAGTLAPTKPPAGFVPPAASAAAAAASAAAPLTKKQAKAARGVAVDAAALPSARAAVAASAAAASAGSIERPAGLRVGLFGQHCMDALQVPESALQRLTALGFSGGSEQEARDYLGSFGLGGAPSVQPLASLSGGQKARAALAFLLLSRPQLLLLDEPTNHFDLATIEALGRAIRSYSGAVVVASHDLRFVQELVGERSGGADDDAGGSSSGGGGASQPPAQQPLAAGEVWVVGDGCVTQWRQSMEAYAQKLSAQVAKQQRQEQKQQQARP